MACTTPGLLAATSNPPQDPSQLFPAVLPALLILAGIVIVAWIVLVMVRRSMQRVDSGLEDSFSLEQLRRMHEAGELDDEEYEQARSVILGHFATPESDTPQAGSEDENEPDPRVK